MKEGTTNITHVIPLSSRNGVPRYPIPYQPDTIAVKVGACSPLIKLIMTVIIIAVAATCAAVGVSLGRAVGKGLFNIDNGDDSSVTKSRTTVTGSPTIDPATLARGSETIMEYSVTETWTASQTFDTDKRETTSPARTLVHQNDQTTYSHSSGLVENGQTTTLEDVGTTNFGQTIKYSEGDTGQTIESDTDDQTNDYSDSDSKATELLVTEYSSGATPTVQMTPNTGYTTQDGNPIDYADESKTTAEVTQDENGDKTSNYMTTESFISKSTDRQTTHARVTDTTFDGQTTNSSNVQTTTSDMGTGVYNVGTTGSGNRTTADSGSTLTQTGDGRTTLDKDRQTTTGNTKTIRYDQSTGSSSDITPDLGATQPNTTP